MGVLQGCSASSRSRGRRGRKPSLVLCSGTNGAGHGEVLDQVAHRNVPECLRWLIGTHQSQIVLFPLEIRMCPSPGLSFLFIKHREISSYQQPSFHNLLLLGLAVQTVTITSLAGQPFPTGCEAPQGRGSEFLRPRRTLASLPSLPHSFHKPAASKLQLYILSWHPAKHKMRVAGPVPGKSPLTLEHYTLSIPLPGPH